MKRGQMRDHHLLSGIIPFTNQSLTRLHFLPGPFAINDSSTISLDHPFGSQSRDTPKRSLRQSASRLLRGSLRPSRERRSHQLPRIEILLQLATPLREPTAFFDTLRRWSLANPSNVGEIH